MADRNQFVDGEIDDLGPLVGLLVVCVEPFPQCDERVGREGQAWLGDALFAKRPDEQVAADD